MKKTLWDCVAETQTTGNKMAIQITRIEREANGQLQMWFREMDRRRGPLPAEHGPSSPIVAVQLLHTPIGEPLYHEHGLMIFAIKTLSGSVYCTYLTRDEANTLSIFSRRANETRTQRARDTPLIAPANNDGEVAMARILACQQARLELIRLNE